MIKVLLANRQTVSALVVFALTTACGSGEVVSSKEVAPPSFHHSLTVTYDQDKQTTKYLASFRKDSVRGDSIKLDDPAQVRVNNAAMKAIDSRDLALAGVILPIPFLGLSMAGYFYSGEGPLEMQNHYRYDVTYPDQSKHEFVISSAAGATPASLTFGQKLPHDVPSLTVELNTPHIDGAVTTVYCYLTYITTDAKGRTDENRIIAITRSGDSCTFENRDWVRIPAGTLQSFHTQTSYQSQESGILGYKTFEIVSRKIAVSN